MRHFAVQGDGFNRTVGAQHDGATRGFITTAGFHPHITVLNNIQTTNAVLTGDLIQVLKDLVGLHGLAINRHDIAFLVGHFDVGRRVGRSFRRYTPAPHIFLGFRPGILQVDAFVRNVEQVGIH